ncbi:MAG: nuclear transport factor 2 family protein [Gemmatimonadales bacterium]
MIRVSGLAVVLSITATPALAQQSDSALVVAIIDAFRQALASGDSAGAIRLFADGGRILESGGVESVGEYRSHHLGADIQFLQATSTTRGPLGVTVAGDVAWAVSTSTTTGEFRGRSVSSTGAELMVLRRTDSGWRIEAVHWSSRSRR